MLGEAPLTTVAQESVEEFVAELHNISGIKTTQEIWLKLFSKMLTRENLVQRTLVLRSSGRKIYIFSILKHESCSAPMSLVSVRRSLIISTDKSSFRRIPM